MSKVKGDMYQILGLDIFIDSNLKPWLLEINQTPSMEIEMKNEMSGGRIKEISEVDKYIKTKIT